MLGAALPPLSVLGMSGALICQICISLSCLLLLLLLLASLSPACPPVLPRPQVFSSCMSVYTYNRAHATERTTSKVYNKAKRMFAHHLVFLALGMAWVCAPSSFFPEHPRIILLTIGMLFGYQVVGFCDADAAAAAAATAAAAAQARSGEWQGA